MRTRRLILLILLMFFVLMSFPCRVARASDDEKGKKNDVGAIGDRRVAHRSIVSQEKETAIGKQYADQIDRSAKLLTDPVVTEYVNRVAQNLARNSDLTIPLTVKVIDAPDLNAFALPGGFLYVNTGLVLAADEEAQLAGVIAHEIAHAAARHWASQMTKATLLQYATIPLIFIPMTQLVYIAVSNAANIAIPMAFLKFDRNAEAEADYLGIQYMYKAGYDPNAYVVFFGKIIDVERKSPGSVPKIFMDHPPTPERMLKSEAEIKKILPPRDSYFVSTSEFDDVKIRLQALTKKVRKEDKQGPTLRRRENTPDDPGGETKQDEKGEEEKPPVLQRRDQ